MLAQSCSVTRRVQQCISFLRLLNTCTGQGKIGSLCSENMQKFPVFLSENPQSFSGNGVLPRTLAHLHLQTGFRYFSANPQESRDEDISDLDAKERNDDKGFKGGSKVDISSESKPIDLLFKEVIGVQEINEDKGFKGGSAVDISSESKPIDLLFKEAIGLQERSETKIQELDIEGLSDLPLEEQVEKLKSKLESQWEILNTLRDSVDGLENHIKELKIKNASLENTKNTLTQNFVEFKKRLRKRIDAITEEDPSLTSIFSKENEKKSVTSNQSKKKKLKIKKKTERVSGALEHPWPEWAQFLEHLNERGYLSKALNFQEGPVDLKGLSTGEIYAFIKFAAISFAKDHVEISKLSGSDLRKVALYCVPSTENKVVRAAKRLRSFYIPEDIASFPGNVEDTSKLELEDVVRLLCAYSLNAEKSELLIPDDIKQSVVNLLKELVDVSASSANDGLGLLLKE